MLDLLSEIRKLGVKPYSSPMVSSLHLIREDETFEDPERYRRLVAKLNYLTITHSDITHLVSIVSQYMSSLTVDHWVAVEQIICYLNGASGCGILYSNHEHNIHKCFMDTN